MIEIRHEESLYYRNTFGIHATASVFVESDNVAELADYIVSLSNPSSVLLLGGGSNVLFVSQRCDVVICPVMKEIELIDETSEFVIVRTGAGVSWDDFVCWCVEHNYAGVENLSYIPGNVGACPIQNIGAYGAEVKEVIEKVEAVEMATGKKIEFSNQQCQFGYRDSFFKNNKGKYLITYVQFRLSKKFEPNLTYSDLKVELSRNIPITIENLRQAVISIRKRKLPDPNDLGNAGSFFKNPLISIEKFNELRMLDPYLRMYPVSEELCKISAAWLIQQCRWKGMRDGNVGVHEQQPLVIVNHGGVTGKDVINFARRIINSVQYKFGIELEPEVNIV